MNIKLPKVVDNNFIKNSKFLLPKYFKDDLVIDFSEVETVGVNFFVILKFLKFELEKNNLGLEVVNIPDQFQSYIQIANSKQGTDSNDMKKSLKEGISDFFFKFGDSSINIFNSIISNIFLAFYILYSSFFSLFRKKTMIKDEPVKQMLLLGFNAALVVILIMSLLGFIMAVQGVYQLEQFGAGIYVAPMLGLSMLRELGPVMTAIIIIGRSGSAVTAEIATMNVNEEIDAIQTMGMDPIQFIVVPKVWAFTIMAPVLTVIGTAFGIFSGALISVIYLKIPMDVFLIEMFSVLSLFDIIFNLFKGLTFGWLIILISVIKGIRVSGGAEEVGSATTSSVVTSIFSIAVLDSIYSIAYIIF